MFLIIGLGNPGKKYEKTRHNTGFLAVDELARLRPFNPKEPTAQLDYGGQVLCFKENKKLKSMVMEIEVNNQKVILAKPLTYMNKTGEAVKALFNYYKINKSLSAIALATADKLIVIYDEIDLPFGAIRVRCKGSSAGHRGVQSIIDNLNTDKFWRLRIGIKNQKADRMSTDKFVLQKFSPLEQKELKEKIFENVVKKIKEIVKK